MFRSVLSSNSVSVSIAKVLNYLSGRLTISVSLFFQGFSLALSVERSSFLFYLTLSVSMNLGEIVICCGLEGIFLCRSILM